MTSFQVPFTTFSPKSRVERPSQFSLKIDMLFQDTVLAHGTGFLTETKAGVVLITARHNLTGRHQETDKCLHTYSAVPDRIAVNFCVEEPNAHMFMAYEQPIYSNGQPLWFEHPKLGTKTDVVALPINPLPNITCYGLSVHEQIKDLVLRPTIRVNVIGYPDMGTSEQKKHKFPVWATGFIASEPNILQEDTFLVDCRGRSGQSGAPVIQYFADGQVSLPSASGGTSIVMYGQPVIHFAGLYAGRISKDSDLGIVWKAGQIQELVASIN